MITFLMIVGITAYFFIGIVTAFAVEDTGDNSVVAICIMAWPLLLLVLAGMWVGSKIRSKMNK